MANQTSTIERKQDGTITITLTIPQTDVKKAQEAVITSAVENAEISGFRKGKAPRNVVEPTLDKTKVREEVLRKLLPETYVAAVEEHNLKPIINPKLHVEKIEDDKDWLVHAHTCEMPEVKLNKYKEAVQKVTAKSKIAIPGQEKQEPSFDEIMKAALDQVEVVIPSLLLEQEVDRLLAQTLDEIKKLGLSLEQYLGSTGKTPEQLRDDYRIKAEGDIKMEFALQKIAETEKITVENKELDEAVQKAKDPIERSHLENNRYLLASIIRQQKTLDFLKNL